MGQYQDGHIIDLVDEINSKYFLPNIQRPFVWDADQTIRLFDSLMRNYPIGTFLFWSVKNVDEIRRRKFIDNYYTKFSRDFNIEKLGLEDTTPRKGITLVLDGQQRLQSIYLALSGKYQDKELYFNLLSGEKEDDEGILYEFDFFKKQPPNDNNHLWVNVKTIVDKFKQKGALVFEVKREILKTYELDKSKEGVIESNIERLKNALISERRISYYDENEEDYNRVFDIFVRVNSGGTPLSKSDLLFSFIKLKWKDFEAEKEIPDLLEKININDQFDFDVDFILKTALMLNGSPIKYNVKNFTGRNGEEIAKQIEAHWTGMKDNITLIVDLIKDEFGINNKKLLPSKNALVPVIYYSYKADKRSKSDFDHKDKEIIKKWLLNILLSRAFGGQSDSLLEVARKSIDPIYKQNEIKFPALQINEEFNKRGKITELKEETMKEIHYTSNNSYLLLYMIYPYAINFKPSNNANYPQQDHIFSTDELELNKYGVEDINRIGNIRLVTANANQRKSDTPYSEWIKSESEKEIGLSLIPNKPESWNISTYKKFVEDREKLILGKIQLII